MPVRAPSRHDDDADLVAACLKGRESAWNALVERYSRLVYSIPKRYGLDDADCHDVSQATFVQLFRRLERLRETSRLSSWLITTAHRESWRVGRANPQTADHLAETIEDVHQPDPEAADRWDRQSRVRQALDELGGRCRDLLTRLFKTDRPDYQAIADELDMPIGSIGPTRARCAKKLAPILERLGFEGPPGG